MGDTHTVTVNDDRFQVIRHPAEGEEGSSLWLTLKSGVTLDFEDDAGSTIMLTLTVTDSSGGSATADVTIEVMNVNEAPMATGELPTVIGTAGEALEGDQTRIDLGEFFKDVDEGDTLTYEATGGPGWLDFEVDEETGHGVLSGTPPAAGPDAEASHTVTITATDGGGLSASRSFTLVVDDGNDPISDIGFTDADGKALPTNNLEISFEENKEGGAGGTLLGTFSAVDPDSEDHPNGMITWSLPRGEERFEIDAKSGELRLKEGESLNFEAAESQSSSINEIPLSVTATDGGDPKSSRTEVLYIEVTNANDAPEAVDTDIRIGWWVTRDDEKASGDDQSDEDYVELGEWLTFGLETRPADQRPAFGDVDLGTGDRLTYRLVDSPSWLQINPATGVMQNRAGMVADEGLYTVTVQATDTGGATADFTFRLAVAESDFTDGEPTPTSATNANPTDNGDPDIDADDAEVDEDAPEGTVVATFTVEDDELPLGPFHPWGRVKVDVDSSWGTGTRGADREDAVAQLGETVEDGDYFSVHHTGTTGNTASYEVRLTEEGAMEIDHEEDGNTGGSANLNRHEVTFTIRAADGTFDIGILRGDGLGDPVSEVPAAGADGADIDDTVTVRFDDVNEAPEYKGGESVNRPFSSPLTSPPFRGPGLTFNVDQEERDVTDDDATSDITRIYLNLTRMFEDPEDEDDDVTFEVELGDGAPWLTLLPSYNSDAGRTMTGAQEWGHILGGRNGAVGGDDGDIAWGARSGADPAPTTPAPTDMVLILAVDRGATPAGSVAQDSDGSITITATDEDGNDSETTFTVRVNDQNLDVSNQAAAAGRVVTLSGPPREGSTLTATFNKRLDPDFRGDDALDENPIVVRYQWFTSPRADSEPNGILDVGSDNMPTYSPPMLRQETTQNHKEMTGSAEYTVRQSDVGGRVEGRVIYYELYDGEIVQSDNDAAGTSDVVEGFASMRTAEVQNTPDVETMLFTVETDFVDTDGNTDPDAHVLRITPTYSPPASRQDLDRPVDEDGDPVGFFDADNDDDDIGYTFNYEWQYSPNGRTLWEVIRDADEDAVESNTGRSPEARQLELPESVQGGYVRLVVIYEDEGDGRDNQVENRVNRIESEAVKVGDIMHVTPGANGLRIENSAGEAPTGIIPAGWTLQIGGLTDPRGGSSKVEWLIGSRVVGEGRQYTVSESDRDSTADDDATDDVSILTARVTRYDADDGLVSRTTVNLPTGVTLTRNEAPILAQAGAHFVDLGKAPDANGKYVMLEDMIDLQALFTDPEGGPVGRFNVSLPSTSIFGTGNGGSGDLIRTTGTLDLYFDNNESDTGSGPNGPAVADGIADNVTGDQLLLIDEADGRIEYHTTREENHNRNTAPDPRDGAGNYISLNVTGQDVFRAPSPVAAMVNLRIDAAPRGFEVSANADNTLGGTPDPADNAANTLTPEGAGHRHEPGYQHQQPLPRPLQAGCSGRHQLYAHGEGAQ